LALGETLSFFSFLGGEKRKTCAAFLSPPKKLKTPKISPKKLYFSKECLLPSSHHFTRTNSIFQGSNGICSDEEVKFRVSMSLIKNFL
jgi:hypothetical protein